MNVYILSYTTWTGTEIISVYSSKEKAERKINRLIKSSKTRYTEGDKINFYIDVHNLELD